MISTTRCATFWRNIFRSLQVCQNRERTGVPARAARVGWWLRPDQRFNLSIDPSQPLGVLTHWEGFGGMHFKFSRLILFLLIFLPATWLFANEKRTPKLVQFHMALLKKGPNLETTTAAERGRIMQQHLANVLSMLDSGKAVIAGPMGDNTDVAGIFILRAKSAEEAKIWVDADPSVSSGLFVAEMHPWWSEDIFKKANSPLKFETVYLGFLKKGANRKDGDDQVPEIQELQKAHIANIDRLAEMK